MRRIYVDHERLNEWQAYLAHLPQQNARRRRCLAQLDRVQRGK